jgi:hypothetical protein
MNPTMQVLSDLQAEQLSGGRRVRPFAAASLVAAPGQRSGRGIGRWFGGGRGFVFQSIQNTVNQINFAINIVIGGGSIFNNQVNVLTMQSSL